MRKVLVFLVASVDGYYEGPDGAFDWPVVDEEFNDFAVEQLDGSDLMVFGRLTYEGMVAWWPTEAARTGDPAVASRMNSANKIVASRTLEAAGVPTPAAYVASQPQQLLALLDLGPLVVKPYQGAGGHQVRIIRTPAELAEVNCGREPVFAQRYHANDGRDRKIYAIDGRLFGVKKVFPRRTEEEKYGEPFTLSPELREIAVRCGRAFGIDLFGVDIIESEGVPYVVDMCSIPGFKGVPDAPRLLAQYFYAVAEQAARAEVPPHPVPLALPGNHTHA